ncbi:SDR family NAD(P)-dependent oxidoreductase [Bifidobacterium breve]|uniref:SDR family NAD(P)-dependent oxidoreductase n=1 Tax=Bifidobacterium breve TaxID=1685 RepID=UPI000397805C|nr:SDR family NAD(P)-dependent oxidoreductase [Bifidobacterium breve]ERI86019.1 acyl transferase domain protein [Bifidobacterium breve JCP7499]TQC90777.1 SDR family NAD(P)-dependent oxidoreductase [Bifidobacterium breve]
MKDDGRIPRIKDTDMTDRLLTAGAIAEDTRNPIGDIAACFPGHGSQSVGMFHGCLSGFPEARQVIARADDLYKERYGERLSTTVGSGRGDRLTMPTVMQPAIVTASLAMFAVLEAAGIPVSMLMGHSLGEYSALIASRAVSFEDGFAAVMDRAETIESIPYAMRGAMAVALPRSLHDMHRVRAVVAELSCRGPLSIAIVNSDEQLVVSGSRALVADVTERLAAESIESFALPIPVGFHSPVLSPVVTEFEHRLERCHWNRPDIPVISTITQGTLQPGDVEHLPQLLAGQLVTPFDFRDCIASCRSAGARVFVDMGPKHIIGTLIEHQLHDGGATVLKLDCGPDGGARTAERIQSLQWLCGTQGNGRKAESEPTKPAATAPRPTADDVRTALLDALCEATGYPAEVIDPDMDLEADLGIDSVKQMQALGTVAERVGIQPESLDLSQARTLRQIVECLEHAEPTAPRRQDGRPADEGPHAAEDASGVKRFVPQIIYKPLADDPGLTDWSDAACLFIRSSDHELDESIRQTLQPLFREVHATTADEIIDSGTHPTVESGTPVRMILDCHSFHDGIPSFGQRSEAWMRIVRERYARTFRLSQILYPLIEHAEDGMAWLSVTGTGGVSGAGSKGKGDPLDALDTGFYKSLGKELRNLQVKTMDVDSPDDVPGAILDEVRHYRQDQDCEMGYLHGRRHVVRVIPMQMRQEHAIRRQLPEGTVAFFSGGSRGIALECAKALADDQPRINVVVTGRSDVDDPRAQRWLRLSDEEWAQAKPDFIREVKRKDPSLGAIALSEEYDRIGHIRILARNLRTAVSARRNLHYIPCDIADAQSTEDAVHKARRQWGDLSLVVHAAGLESFGRLPGKTLDRTMRSIAVKLGGFINLYHATKDEPSLTAFVSFGSVSGRFGMDGQVDYTAAAAALSALSHTIPMNMPADRRIPFVTMEWSAWGQVGMAVHPQVIAVQEQDRGMEYIPVRTGTEFFLDELALGTADPEVLIMGSLGSNRPQGQLDSLDDGLELISPIEETTGTVVDKPHYPMLDSVDRQDADTILAHRMLRYDRDLYLPDHRVKGVTTFPGVLHLETQIEAASCLSNVKRFGVELEELELNTFLKCRDNDEVPITVNAHRTDRTDGQVIATELYSTFKTPDGRTLIPHRTHSTAVIRLLDKAPEPCRADWRPERLLEQGTPVDIGRYHAETEHFISFGPTFRYMRRARLIGDDCAAGEFMVPSVPGLFSDVRNPQFLCCPLLIDNVGRMALMREFQLRGRHVVPIRIHGARQFRCPAAGELCYGKMDFLTEDEQGVDVHIEIIDANGYLLCQADDVRLTILGPAEQEHDIMASPDAVEPAKEQ